MNRRFGLMDEPTDGGTDGLEGAKNRPQATRKPYPCPAILCDAVLGRAARDDIRTILELKYRRAILVTRATGMTRISLCSTGHCPLLLSFSFGNFSLVKGVHNHIVTIFYDHEPKKVAKKSI